MTAPAHITRLTTSDQVAQELRRRIWTGELSGGQRLTQEELAEAMGVSRIPVREALIELDREGAVRMEPHRGAYVEPLTETSITDHYELYGQIDGFALRRAIERSDHAGLRALSAAFDAGAGCADARTMQRQMVTTRDHIHAAGGSPRLRAVVRGLIGLVAGNFFDEVPGSLAVAQQRLAEIGPAIRTGDTDRAVESYQAMLGEHGALVCQTLTHRGVLH